MTTSNCTRSQRSECVMLAKARRERPLHIHPHISQLQGRCRSASIERRMALRPSIASDVLGCCVQTVAYARHGMRLPHAREQPPFGFDQPRLRLLRIDLRPGTRSSSSKGPYASTAAYPPTAATGHPAHAHLTWAALANDRNCRRRHHRRR
ncbi:hypothetical protein BD413DRAFT_237452 [Trametes elegans]|nr:hypothetical protein BD413DRAFT_237452 [Trametes elegans]